jgi:hypothetical protein
MNTNGKADRGALAALLTESPDRVARTVSTA